jgi:NAD(P)-dependent dehydrogenase (short-subunit alcohol dehydrogenase family)
MKILIIGASGTVGSLVAAALSERHEIMRAGSKSGDVRVDIRDPSAIRRMFDQVGTVDAVVSTAGKVHFGPFAEMTEAEIGIGLKDKLMGQVNLVLIGRDHVADGSSFTLTSGLLSHDPIRFGVGASLVNGAIDSFVRAAAIELPRGLRINAVSPGVLEESLPTYGPYFRGHDAVPGKRVANAYVKSVEGLLTGQVISVL